MLTAINTEGIKVSADKADKKEKYFCPTCGAEMILKQGSKISWHFAHPKERVEFILGYEQLFFKASSF